MLAILKPKHITFKRWMQWSAKPQNVLQPEKSEAHNGTLTRTKRNNDHKLKLQGMTVQLHLTQILQSVEPLS